MVDPNYARAHVGLARALFSLSSSIGALTADAQVSQRRGLFGVEKAIAVDPELAEAYGTRSYLRRIYPGDWEGAQADLARVLALEPGNPAAQMNMGTLLTAMGRAPEAIILLMEAVKRDPTFDLAWPALGEAYLANGQIALAKDALTRALEISPEDTRALVQLGNLALIAGDPTAALAIYQRSSAEASRVFGSALAPHEIGHTTESQQALETLIARFAPDAAYQVAGIYAWRGEKDHAFEWLERAYVQQDSGLSALKFDPLLHNLRVDRRYTALRKKMNLPVN